MDGRPHLSHDLPYSVPKLGKKEVAERWKRGTKGAETNAEGVRIEAPRGGERGGGDPLPNQLGGLGKRRELK